MFARSAIIIDKEKSKKFRKLMSENAKNKEFWDEIKKTVSDEKKGE